MPTNALKLDAITVKCRPVAEIKREFNPKNYSFKWTFMFYEVAYTARKWQFVSNKYDVWRFISCILLAYYDPSKIAIAYAIEYSMVGVSPERPSFPPYSSSLW